MSEEITIDQFKKALRHMTEHMSPLDFRLLAKGSTLTLIHHEEPYFTLDMKLEMYESM